jgi:hypothetical protein
LSSFAHSLYGYLFFAENDGDNISIALPPSQHGWTITVTKSPQTSSNVHVMKDRPGTFSRNIAGTPAPGVGADPTGPAVDAQLISFAMANLSLGPDESRTRPASHLRVCPPKEQFSVSDDVQKRFPPFKGRWGPRSWVVIFRGRDIGVFHEFWYVRLLWCYCSLMI